MDERLNMNKYFKVFHSWKMSISRTATNKTDQWIIYTVFNGNMGPFFYYFWEKSISFPNTNKDNTDAKQIPSLNSFIYLVEALLNSVSSIYTFQCCHLLAFSWNSSQVASVGILNHLQLRLFLIFFMLKQIVDFLREFPF